MKKLFFCLFISILFVSVKNIANAQNAKSNITVAEAKADLSKLEIELTKPQFDIVSKNHETFYKDFLILDVKNSNNNMVLAEISSTKPENNRIIKRILIASEIKEIQFKDKKISIDEFFGF
jgi:LAS superfamily LD-carboxypeptidase LdcB